MYDHRLSAAERRDYERDGYVVRRDVFEPHELRAITDACERLVVDLAAGRQGNRETFGSYVFDIDAERETTIKWEGDTDIVHGVEPLVHLSPQLERWAMDPRLVDPMVDIVGDESPMLFTEKLNLKRPRHGGVNPLHQDFPYWHDFADDASRIATAMLFLDDATLENGTLQVVPGSHHRGQWPTRRDRDEFGNLEIDPAEEEGVTLVPVEVEAGTVLFFGPLLAHKSAPNTSDHERRTILYSYQPAGLAHFRACARRRTEREPA